MYDAVLLDVDKTLVDVEDHVDYCRVVGELRRLAPDLAEVEAQETSWGRCTRTAMALLAALAGDPRWHMASEVVEQAESQGVAGCTPMPGVDRLFAVLDPARTALVTLLGERPAREALRRHGLPDVAVVVARSPGMRPKPAPDQPREALRRLGTAPDRAVMVGDSEVDAMAALGAGMAFVGVTNGRADHRFPAGVEVVRDLVEVAQALGR